MSAQEHAVYRFADCELDVRERRLLVRGQPVTLTPKVFDTLVLLAERAGHVVSKDELMAALWPRGFVHESNLTKHIWLIRRALGDGDDESRYIETVPKVGYRFVAPVRPMARVDPSSKNIVEQSDSAFTSPNSAAALTVPAGDGNAMTPALVGEREGERARHLLGGGHGGQLLADAAQHAAPVVRRGDRLGLMVIGLALIALVGGVYGWRAARTPVPVALPAPDAGAVAIVDFNNLSGHAKDAWLGPALEQMLANEVAANGKLHAVSEELVRPARVDLPASGAGGYAPTSLATLQRRLGVHYVLSGAYFVSGAVDAPRMRVDLTVQDTQTGKLFASLSHSAAVNDLPNLVARIGGELRNRFGESPASPTLLREIAAAQPPTAEVARHVGFALQALRAYDPARARDELLQAIAQSPGYAPAYLYLSRAWTMLGYRAKAVAAAKQAAQNAAGLPHEQQLQIRAQQAALAGDVARVSAIQGELVTLRPHDPGYRMRWIGTLVAAAKYNAARKVLADARKLPALAGDPRLELAAARLEFALRDYAAVISHARLALEQSRQRGETGLIAEAELRMGIAYQQDPKAEPLLRSAIADYHRIGNPHGEALAWQNLGNLQGARNQIGPARENYQRAMTIYQGIGDLGGEAAIYDNLSNMLWSAGDRDGTQAALRQALIIARETADPVRQAWTLTGLATVMSDDAASGEAAAMYREAIALDRQTGARAHFVFALASYADLLRMRGELDEAREICQQARAPLQGSNVFDQGATADFECAQIALDRGEVTAAVASLTAIESKSLAAKDTFGSANAQMLLGQIAMGRKRWDDARKALRRSSAGWVAMKEAPGEATTAALLALCADAVGDQAMRDRFAAHARELRAQVTARAEVFELDIALAELQAAAGKRDQALASLRGLAGDATKRNWPGLSFEARLAELRVLERGGDPAAIKSVRDPLDADARKAGYGWVSQRLAMLTTASTDAARH